MDVLESVQGIGRKGPLAIAVLNVPARSTLVTVPSQSAEYQLLYHSKKKMTMAVYKIQLPRAKLFANLEIYEWRHQTEFPIVKTRHIAVHVDPQQPSHLVTLEVYNEYCPIKLTQILKLNLGQSLYFLKECIVGF